MNDSALVDSLDRFAAVLATVTRGVPDAHARWKPPDSAWSILEITCHLADEEVEDFRARLKLVLEDPDAPWTPIAPERWAVDRHYNQQDLKVAVDRFVAERRASVTWLRSLGNPDWSRTRVHPKFGRIRAGDLLAAWAAHDALHLRQLAKRMHQLAQLHAGAFETNYAGPWSA